MRKSWASICLFILFGLSVSSCGESQDEKVSRAIIEANQYLSTRSCGPAIRVLENVGRQNHNGLYLITLASAYACRAGHSEITFFADDISKIGAPSTYGGSTRFSTSPDYDHIDNSIFDDLHEAIEILLYAGAQPRSDDPSFSVIESEIGDRAGDMMAAALYMMLVQKGRFLHLFGDAAGGEKNRCILEYDPGLTGVDDYLDNQTSAACDSGNMTAASDLGSPGNYDVEMICHGVVITNTLIELIPVVINAYAGGELDDIEDIIDTLQDLRDDATTIFPGSGIGPLLSVMSVRKCVADHTGDDDLFQYYYALFYETLFD